jgi:glutaredoxin
MQMRIWLAMILLAIAGGAAAQTTYRWVDKDGKVHYSDNRPAPGDAKSVEQKRASQLGVPVQELPYTVRQAAADFPVTLYTQAQCGDVCTTAHDYLTRRSIPFTTKDVATAADIASLKALLGGAEAVLPVLQVGSRIIKGYQSDEWEKLIDAAGYPKPKSAKP